MQNIIILERKLHNIIINAGESFMKFVQQSACIRKLISRKKTIKIEKDNKPWAIINNGAKNLHYQEHSR